MDEYENLNLDNLGQHLAKDVELAKNQTSDPGTDIAHEQIKLEEKRIRAEERMNDRNAERDETVAEIHSLADQYKSILDQFIEQFRGLSSGSSQSVSVDASQPITPIAPASEDIEEESAGENDGSETALSPALEEIGGSTEKTVEKETPEVENNASSSGGARRGRKTRRK